MSATFDFSCVGFYTFDALCRPVTEIPPAGQTLFVEDFTLAVSGAAGSAAIVAAKYGLKVQAVGGVGYDDMGDWVRMKLQSFDVDTTMMRRYEGYSTSCSIVTTRPNGQRPALHKRGATDAFFVSDSEIDRVLDTKILHVGGVGLMNRMDDCGRTAEIMAEARRRGVITTLDVFASTSADLPKVEALLPYTDYFLPSEEEAQALSGLTHNKDLADFLLGRGAKCVILTLGAEGAYYHDESGLEFHSPAFQVDVKCTCGCGDCFNGGFASGLAKGLTPQDAVELGQASSALNATGLGSQAGVANYDATHAFIKATPRRQLQYDVAALTEVH
ncbi:sugar kinase [Rhizobium sp. CNPSo 3490]|uniref:carbohydrate kinase family protein n=1 Tax=Rhizobium sp. CNPSo 3490 TaxID=3021407 RepID=UPI00254B6BA2|nr:sugar kinase [Rhizobium sp. CNPSo 3490]MDK4737072.1 sugar kinase [Rhizobium sp. CNPSo 3490]